jgi:hypothetical protein
MQRDGIAIIHQSKKHSAQQGFTLLLQMLTADTACIMKKFYFVW